MTSQVVSLIGADDPEKAAKDALDAAHAAGHEVSEFILDASQEFALCGDVGNKLKTLWDVPVHVAYAIAED